MFYSEKTHTRAVLTWQIKHRHYYRGVSRNCVISAALKALAIWIANNKHTGQCHLPTVRKWSTLLALAILSLSETASSRNPLLFQYIWTLRPKNWRQYEEQNEQTGMTQHETYWICPFQEFQSIKCGWISGGFGIKKGIQTSFTSGTNWFCNAFFDTVIAGLHLSSLHCISCSWEVTNNTSTPLHNVTNPADDKPNSE